MLSSKLQGLLMICMLSTIGINAQMFHYDISNLNDLGDYIGGYPPVNPDLVKSCTHGSLVFINCDDLIASNLHFTHDFTIAVLDDGLTPLQWHYLETNPYARVDIIKYVFYDEGTGQIIETGNEGVDMYNQIPDYYNTKVPNDNSHEVYPIHPITHAVGVLAALGTVYRNARIVFIDIDSMNNDPKSHFGGDLGFIMFPVTYDSTKDPFNWIINNQAKYNIRIISMSANFPTGFSMTTTEYFTQLYNKGVTMVVAGGNHPYPYNLRQEDGRYYFYPQIYPEWHAIASVNHNTSQRSWFSAWGDTYKDMAGSIDFAMPGEYVPIIRPTIIDTLGTHKLSWIKNRGTSYSAPYFAAAVAMVLEGRLAANKKCDYPLSYPSVSEIISFLKDNTGMPWNHLLGWGWVDVYRAYQDSFDQNLGCTNNNKFSYW